MNNLQEEGFKRDVIPSQKEGFKNNKTILPNEIIYKLIYEHKCYNILLTCRSFWYDYVEKWKKEYDWLLKKIGYDNEKIIGFVLKKSKNPNKNYYDYQYGIKIFKSDKIFINLNEYNLNKYKIKINNETEKILINRCIYLSNINNLQHKLRNHNIQKLKINIENIKFTYILVDNYYYHINKAIINYNYNDIFLLFYDDTINENNFVKNYCLNINYVSLKETNYITILKRNKIDLPKLYDLKNSKIIKKFFEKK